MGNVMISEREMTYGSWTFLSTMCTSFMDIGCAYEMGLVVIVNVDGAAVLGNSLLLDMEGQRRPFRSGTSVTPWKSFS